MLLPVPGCVVCMLVLVLVLGFELGRGYLVGWVRCVWLTCEFWGLGGVLGGVLLGWWVG